MKLRRAYRIGERHNVDRGAVLLEVVLALVLFVAAAAKAGVKVELQYWTTGAYDGVLILSADDENDLTTEEWRSAHGFGLARRSSSIGVMLDNQRGPLVRNSSSSLLNVCVVCSNAVDVSLPR